MVRTALVHDWLNGMRGGEKVLEVFCDIFPDADIYTLFYEPGAVSDKINKHNPVPSFLQKFPLVKNHYRWLLPLFPAAVKRFDLSGYDLVISISHCAAKGVKVPREKTHVCYCLTPMRYVWDKYEDYFGRRAKWSPARIAMSILRGPLQHWDVKTATGVDFFIATSEFIRKRIKKYYGEESIIIHPPVDVEFFHPARNQEEKPADSGDQYYLLASALVPYKRVDIAIEAFRKRRDNLIVVGSGPERENLEKSASSNIQFCGWVSNESLREIYRGARALIFPPEEDFGIIPLEASACGCPVIAYDAGGARETVIHGKTGLLFPEQTPESLNEALSEFNPRDFETGVMVKHARKFSREECKKKLKRYFTDKAGDLC